MKTRKSKKTKVESSSEEESDSSTSSSSTSSSSSSSNDSDRNKSATKKKKRKVSETGSKNLKKHESSRTKITKEIVKEIPRKSHHKDDSHQYTKIHYEKESHNNTKQDRNRDGKEKYRENEPERIRHENYNDQRETRNERERERGDSDKFKRPRYNDQYNNYNRNSYQQDASRERHRQSDAAYHRGDDGHRRTDESYHRAEESHRRSEESHRRADESHYKTDESRRRSDESHRRPDEARRNQNYRERNTREYDDQRGGNRYGRNNRARSRSRSFDHTSAKWGKGEDNNIKKEKAKPVDKEKPNFGLSGKLTEERNTFKGVVIKYSEPPEARKPKRRWRLYPFKGEKALQTLYIHRESAYLIGRERKVVDLAIDHPSCSKQHAALQYRLVPFTREDGSAGKRVRPYLIDLDSANGTYINNKKIDPKKYVELMERDVIKFGFSSREYVLLHENSKDEAQDDDVKQEEEEVNVKNEPEG